MTSMTRAASSIAALAAMILLSSETALAACNATVNGRPMSPQECVLALQVYGQAVPGNYRVDNQGNWVNVNNPWHRGNTYRDAQRPRGGAWSGQSSVSPRGIYDPADGCEGGSCVNIID